MTDRPCTARAHPLLTGIPLVLYYGPNLIRVLVFIPWLTFQLVLRGLGFGREGVERGRSSETVLHQTTKLPWQVPWQPATSRSITRTEQVEYLTIRRLRTCNRQELVRRPGGRLLSCSSGMPST